MNTIYLSLGSNIGDRYAYLQQAIVLLRKDIVDIKQSSTYETKPWGFDNQNQFLNLVLEAQTKLSSRELLTRIQTIQETIGRQKTILNGPRTIDIDIVFYGEDVVQEKDLVIPHPRAHTRDFVMVPMMEINANFYHLVLCKTISELAPLAETYIMKRHIPTQIVGILNLSPESFGSTYYTDMASILKIVEEMMSQGVDWIDIGAQSTKPGTPQISEAEEIGRIKGIIATIKEKYSHIKISIDTTRASCAQIAIDEGVDMINDISGGGFDPLMIPLIVKNPHVKFVVTHSRGNFESMHKVYVYTDIIAELQEYFKERIHELTQAGVSSKQIILDPGIGFSKNGKENFEIIRRLDELHTLAYPLYVGLSRKKFIGQTIQEPEDYLFRDVGSNVLHTICLQKGVAYIRTHNVKFLDCAKKVLENM